MSAPSDFDTVDTGQARAHHVVVDSTSAVVSRFQFAPISFFLHSPSTPQHTWRDICGKPIALEVEGGKIVTIELCDTDSKRSTVFLVRSLTEDTDANPRDDFFKRFMKLKVASAGRLIKGKVTIRDIILEVQAANLTKYQLADGRGHRFWIRVVLSTIQKYIREPPRGAQLKGEAEKSCAAIG
ncbi:hypothetical protein F5Y05DRAFT_411385 [Hypoxylon sp. FL0543]|nr:hypothetical protein F5Y05DRAFT_411385 [Hypoxylon sp. FL0543]